MLLMLWMLTRGINLASTGPKGRSILLGPEGPGRSIHSLSKPIPDKTNNMRTINSLLSFLLFSFTLGAQNYTGPAVSPDGQWLALAYDEGGNQDIFVARIDGTELRCLARLPGLDVQPRWSPDGQKVLFNSFPREAGLPHDVYIINFDGTGLANLTRGRFPDGQANDWHPGGKRVLISSGKYPAINIYALNLDGTSVEQITREGNMVCYYASYSLKGDKILFSGYTDPDRGLYLINADGAGKQEIRPGGDAGAWSPAGRKIAFQEKRGGLFYLMWMNADGSGVEPLLGKEIHGQAPSWAPDGRKVFYHTPGEEGRMQIRELDLRSGRSRQVLPLQGERR